MKANIYDQITNAIVAQLEAGIIPWQKPWQNGSFMGCISHTTGKPYSLLNQWLLNCREGEWLTYGQVIAAGGHVKKGEKSSMVVFWTFVDRYELEAVCDERGDEIGTRKVKVGSYPILKGYSVFHIDQCEGIKPRWDKGGKTYDHTPIEEAEQIAMGYVEREGLTLNIQPSNEACYSPVLDRVKVPELKQYKICEEYYSTLFHELVHSTGHATRLNRDGVAGLHYFGSTSYSKEELVAEIGAAFLCNQAGLDSSKAFNNSVAYIGGWLSKLKDDKRMIVQAAAKAEQAARYILTGKK